MELGFFKFKPSESQKNKGGSVVIKNPHPENIIEKGPEHGKFEGKAIEQEPKQDDYAYSREAAKITLGRVNKYEELNADTQTDGDKKFNELTRKLWDKFAVHGIFLFNPKTKERDFKPETDLDGRSSLELLKLAGIDTTNVNYIKPGEIEKGRINLDTGNIYGVQYDQETDTAIFDHHGSESRPITSATEVVYKTLIDLDTLRVKNFKKLDIVKDGTLEKLVDFVTKMDNGKFSTGEFINSGKTIIGVQRHLDFDNLLKYFEEHNSPTDILTAEELERYGLKEPAEKQQKIVDEAMETLAKMENEGKTVDTKYGSFVVNINNELKVGSSAAYTRHDGIINLTPGKSFAVTMKNGVFNEEALKKKLGENFQGKIIRGNMWIYNESEPLKLNLEEIEKALK